MALAKQVLSYIRMAQLQMTMQQSADVFAERENQLEFG